MHHNPRRNKCRVCGVALPAHKGPGQPQTVCQPRTGRPCKRIVERIGEAKRLLAKLHETEPARRGKIRSRARTLADTLIPEV